MLLKFKKLYSGGIATLTQLQIIYAKLTRPSFYVVKSLPTVTTNKLQAYQQAPPTGVLRTWLLLKFSHNKS